MPLIRVFGAEIVKARWRVTRQQQFGVLRFA